eukprot:PhM_4_TR15911/c2_g1_i9/m.3370
MIRLVEDPVFQGHVVRFPAENVDPAAGCPILYKDVHLEQQPRRIAVPRTYAEEFLGGQPRVAAPRALVADTDSDDSGRGQQARRYHTEQPECVQPRVAVSRALAAEPGTDSDDSDRGQQARRQNYNEQGRLQPRVAATRKLKSWPDCASKFRRAGTGWLGSSRRSVRRNAKCQQPPRLQLKSAGKRNRTPSVRQTPYWLGTSLRSSQAS